MKEIDNKMLIFLFIRSISQYRSKETLILQIMDSSTIEKTSKDKPLHHIIFKRLNKINKIFTSIEKPKAWSVLKGQTINRMLKFILKEILIEIRNAIEH